MPLLAIEQERRAVDERPGEILSASEPLVLLLLRRGCQRLGQLHPRGILAAIISSQLCFLGIATLVRGDSQYRRDVFRKRLQIERTMGRRYGDAELSDRVLVVQLMIQRERQDHATRAGEIILQLKNGPVV